METVMLDLEEELLMVMFPGKLASENWLPIWEVKAIKKHNFTLPLGALPTLTLQTKTIMPKNMSYRLELLSKLYLLTLRLLKLM
jgi:hypothetical protein